MVVPSFAPMWNSVVLSPSVTSRFMTRFWPGGASAACSAMSFDAASNHPSERNSCLSATRNLPRVSRVVRIVGERPRPRRPASERTAGASCLRLGYGGRDETRAHRGAGTQSQVAEPAVAHRDVGVHQLRRLP